MSTYRVRTRAALAAAAVLAIVGAPLAGPAVAVTPAGPVPTGGRTTVATGVGEVRAAPAGAAGFGLQAARNGKPDSRSILSYAATPGAKIPDEVAVVNLGTQPLTLSLYATDATSGSTGEVALLPATTRPKDVGRWITVDSTGSVRVPARTSAGPSHVIVKFALSVPGNASPGDHVGGIVVALASSARGSGGVDVPLDQRVALPVVTRVSGTIRARLAVENLTAVWHGPALTSGNPLARGYVTLSYRVHNVGNVQLGATQVADVDPLLGPDATIKPPDVPTLLPGASVDLRVRVASVFPGVRVDGSVALAPIATPGTGRVALPRVSASTSTWAVPWLLFVVVVLVALVVVLLVRRARRPRAVAAHSRAARHHAGAGRSSRNGTVTS